MFIVSIVRLRSRPLGAAPHVRDLIAERCDGLYQLAALLRVELPHNPVVVVTRPSHVSVDDYPPPVGPRRPGQRPVVGGQASGVSMTASLGERALRTARLVTSPKAEPPRRTSAEEEDERDRGKHHRNDETDDDRRWSVVGVTSWRLSTEWRRSGD